MFGLWFCCLWVTRWLPKLPQSHFHTTASKDKKRKLRSRVSLYQVGSSVFPSVVRGGQLWSGGWTGRQRALCPAAISVTTSVWWPEVGFEAGSWAASLWCLLPCFRLLSSHRTAVLRLSLTAWVTAHQLGYRQSRTELSLQSRRWANRGGGAQMDRSWRWSRLSALLPAVTSNPPTRDWLWGLREASHCTGKRTSRPGSTFQSTRTETQVKPAEKQKGKSLVHGSNWSQGRDSGPV